jgi:hypothetical protein
MRLICVFLLGSCLFAQAPPPSGGMESEWDLKTMLKALAAGAKRLQPLMEQVNPAKWENTQGASAYTAQWKAAQDEIRYLDHSANSFAKEPERLTLGLETYFRLQSIQNAIGSFTEGVRKYQNPAVADLLQSELSENLRNRAQLRAYLTELAQQKEQELKIMDQEAQRCRGVVNRHPPAPAPKSGTKK